MIIFVKTSRKEGFSFFSFLFKREFIFPSFFVKIFFYFNNWFYICLTKN